MSQHSTSPSCRRPSASLPAASPAPRLVPILCELLAASRTVADQERVFARVVVLVFGMLSALGRHTLTQLQAAVGLGDQDWSGFARVFSQQRFHPEAAGVALVRATLAAVGDDAPYLVAIDGVQVPRTSQRLPGTSWLKCPRTPPWKPGIHRAQRLSHLAWLTPISPDGDSRAVPLRVVPATPPKAVRPSDATQAAALDLVATREWEAGLASLHWLRQTLDAAGRPAQQILAVADGSYSGARMWTGLPARTTLLARCPKNRALYAVPAAQTGRGRPRKYGERAPAPADWLSERAGWQRTVVRVRGRSIPVTYRVEGPYLVKPAATQPLYLLVVRGIDRQPGHKHRPPAYWLVSAQPACGATASGPPVDGWVLPYPAALLLSVAWQRWEIEVCHRQAKTSLGVGEAQSWTAAGTVRAVQFQWWVYGLLVLTAYRAWGHGPAPVRLPGRWWPGGRRWSFAQLWQALRAELWDLGDFQPAALRLPHDWWDIPAQLGSLAIAGQAAQRG